MSCAHGGPRHPCGPVEVVLGHGVAPELELQGNKEKVRVSASGRVYRGEFVQKVKEYAAEGDELRFALEGVHILDAVEIGRGRVGVVFTQGAATKFKILALEGGALALGNTLVLVEDEAVEDAAVVWLNDGQCLVLYNQDAAGLAALVTLDGRVAALAYTDIWDDQDPANLCGCAMENGWALVCGTRQSTTHAGEAWVRSVKPGVSKLDTKPDIRVDGGNDTDSYSGGWSLAHVADGVAVLAYPQALDKPVGFALLDVASSGEVSVRVTAQGKYAASLPTLRAVGLSGGRWALVYGVGWLAPDKQVVKSTLAMEVWSLTQYAAELLWYGCEETQYAAAIGGVSAGYTGVGLAASFTGEEGGQVMLMDTAMGPYPGPAVNLGEHDGFFRAVPIAMGRALLVKQRAGNGYVQALEEALTVIPSDTLAGGVAISGGGPGETITIVAAG